MNPNTILVHDRDGCFWMDKHKWPVLRLDCEKENPKILEEAETQREGGMMLKNTSAIEEILAEKEDEGNPWDISLPPKSRRDNPVVGTRKSSRILSREDVVMGGFFQFQRYLF